MLPIMIEQTVIAFILIGLGWVCRRRNVFDLSFQRGMASLVLTVALPSKLVSVANIPIADVGIDRIVVFCTIVFCYFVSMLVVLNLVARRLPLTDLLKKQVPILIIFPSSAFLGIPIISALYQEAGVFLMGLFAIFYSMFQYTYGIGIYTGIKRENFVKLIKTPLLIASLTMIVLFVFQITLPSVIQRSLSTVGAMAVPMSLIVVGGTIAQHSVLRVLQGKLQYGIAFVRLILVPLTAILIFYLLGIDSMVAIILSLVFSLPTSSTSAVIADQYSGDSLFASVCVVHSFLMFLVTVPFITMLVNHLWVF